jgi:hypothetical protein
MARSHSIWIVVGDASRLPVFAATVKHELVTWLETRRGNKMLRLFRVNDGAWPSGRDEVDIEYLLDNPTRPVKLIKGL